MLELRQTCRLIMKRMSGTKRVFVVEAGMGSCEICIIELWDIGNGVHCSRRCVDDTSLKWFVGWI